MKKAVVDRVIIATVITAAVVGILVFYIPKYIMLKPTAPVIPSETAECDQLEGHAKTICLFKFIASKNDTLRCSLISDSPLVQNCINSTWLKKDCTFEEDIGEGTDCHTKLASSQNNITICNKILTPRESLNCRRALISKWRDSSDPSFCDDTSCVIQVVNRKGDVGICNKLNNEILKRTCEEAVLSDKDLFELTFPRITEISRQLSPLVQKNAESINIFSNAEAYLRPALCSKISSTDALLAFDEFSDELAKSIEPDHHHESEIENITGHNLIPSDYCLLIISSKIYDQSLCQNITSFTWEKVCNAQFIDINCDDIEDTFAKNTCINNKIKNNRSLIPIFAAT